MTKAVGWTVFGIRISDHSIECQRRTGYYKVVLAAVLFATSYVLAGGMVSHNAPDVDEIRFALAARDKSYLSYPSYDRTRPSVARGADKDAARP